MAVAVGVDVTVAVAVAVGVDVGSGVGVNVAVGVAVAVAVAVAVGVGVGLDSGLVTSTYLESLGIPLVKTVTNAGPGGKLLTGAESKMVSDQPAIGSAGRKTTWLLSIARSWTTGELVDESWRFPPEACEMPRKREPVSVRLLPSTRGEVAVAICGCQSGAKNPRPMSYNSALGMGPLGPCPPVTSTLPLESTVAV